MKPSTPTTPSDSEAEARRDYELAEQAGTRKSWEDFPNKHPSGFYAGLAREQLVKLDVPVGPDSKPIPKTPAVEDGPDVNDLDAIKDLDRKLQNNPSDAAAFFRRGQLYANIADFFHAIQDFDEALRLRPKDAEALNNRCWARAMVGDFQTAEGLHRGAAASARLRRCLGQPRLCQTENWPAFERNRRL